MSVPRQLLNAKVLHSVTLWVVLVIWIAGCSGQIASTTLTPCQFNLSSSNVSYDSSASKGSLTVISPANCSWTARSDADWLVVTGGSSGLGNATVTYGLTANTTNSTRAASIEVGDATRSSDIVLFQVNQTASLWLRIRGAYTFVIRIDSDGTCGWPVTKFYWPVAIKDTSFKEGNTIGSIAFPSTQISASFTWGITTGPTYTQLMTRQQSLGSAIGKYEVVVDGGLWEAGGLSRAPSGKGQITDGTASGTTQILTLRSSGQQWECHSDVNWSLITRYIDQD